MLPEQKQNNVWNICFIYFLNLLIMNVDHYLYFNQMTKTKQSLLVIYIM
jgi:hypothetical protein